MGGKGNNKDRARLGLSLASGILVLFIPLFLFISLFLIAYNQEKNADVVLEVADRLMETVSEKVIEKTHGMIGVPMGMINMAAALPDLEQGLNPARTRITDYFRAGLEEFPHLYGVFVAYPNGDFLQVIRVSALDDTVRARLAVPHRTWYGARWISRQEDGKRRESWAFLDGAGRVVGRRVSPEATYDPRVRPWYRKAVDGDDVALSEIYVFESLRRPGLTISRRVTGTDGVVVAADIPLSSLSEFLRDQQVTPSSTIFVYNRAGEIIAHPEADRIVRIAGDARDSKARVRSVTVEEFGDPVLREAVAVRDRDGGRRFVFTLDDTDYVASFTPIPSVYGIGLNVAIVSPLDDFLGPLTAHGRNSLVFSLVVLALAVPLLILVANWIARPVKALAREADRIGRFHMEEVGEFGSRVREIRRLADSIAGMKAAIHTFSTYMPKKLVRQMIESGVSPALGGVERDLTVMFTDVENSTELAETLPAEDLMRKFSTYLERISRVVNDADGTIDKFIGDSVMAFWNAPFDEPDHVAKACTAALLCHAETDQLNDAWVGEGRQPMFTRIGLHVGPAIVGNVGSSDRMNYTAIGATVNMAARLEDLNKQYGTRILVSQDVVDQVGTRFLFRAIDEVTPRGATAPTAVYELLGAHDGDERIRAGDDLIAFAADWDVAHRALRRGDVAEAQGRLRELRLRHPHDGPIRAFLERCEHRLAAL
ncbi:MAG: hypothetical protein H6907_03115 [Hyphomicrobiales bacterium]|nr:hypothetical protein [Hyphomicrobiales bacterium]MCP5370697.1 hypothetical protein [Hyphomicrobiales bacterium]